MFLAKAKSIKHKSGLFITLNQYPKKNYFLKTKSFSFKTQKTFSLSVNLSCLATYTVQNSALTLNFSFKTPQFLCLS